MRSYTEIAKDLLREIGRRHRTHRVVKELSEELKSSLESLGNLASKHNHPTLKNVIYGVVFGRKPGLLSVLDNIPKTISVDGELAAIFMIAVSFQMLEQVLEEPISSPEFMEEFIPMYGGPVLEKNVTEYFEGIESFDKVTQHIIIEKSLGLITSICHEIWEIVKDTDNDGLKELALAYATILQDEAFDISGSFFKLHKMIHYGDLGVKDTLMQYVGLIMGMVHSIYISPNPPDKLQEYFSNLSGRAIYFDENSIRVGGIKFDIPRPEDEIEEWEC